MKLLVPVILSILLSVHGASIEKNCDGLKIDDIYYEEEVLKTNLNRPFLLATDYKTNTIYFSYSSDQEEDDDSYSALLDINTQEWKNITDLKDGFAQTVDPKTSTVYISTEDGIYTYDHSSGKAEFYAEKGKSMWSLFYKDVLYYSEYPSYILYSISNGETTRVKDLEDRKVDKFVIDKDDDMFYSNPTGLYKQKKGTKDAIALIESKSLSIRGITTDVDGNVYICQQDGIYIVKKPENEIKKVVEIDDAFGVTFDSDKNIIYGDINRLVRLKPDENKTKRCNEIQENI